MPTAIEPALGLLEIESIAVGIEVESNTGPIRHDHVLVDDAPVQTHSRPDADVGEDDRVGDVCVVVDVAARADDRTLDV